MPARLMARSTIASSSRTAIGSTPPSAHRRASTSANSASAETLSSASGAAARSFALAASARVSGFGSGRFAWRSAATRAFSPPAWPSMNLKKAPCSNGSPTER